MVISPDGIFITFCFKSLTKKYSTYKKFNNNLEEYQKKLQNFHNAIKSLPSNKTKFTKIIFVGKLMKYFYTLYDSEEIENIIEFIDGINRIKFKLKSKLSTNKKTIVDIVFKKNKKT